MSAENENDQPAPLGPDEVARALDEALAAVGAAGTLDELKAARLAHDGDRSPLTLASAGIGALPPQLAALNRTFVNVCELTVRAALDGDREHVYHAALLDPNASGTLTPAAICSMVDDLIDAHADALPAGIVAGRRASFGVL